MEKVLTYVQILIILVSLGTLIFFFNQNQGYWWDEAVYLGLADSIQSGNYWINTPGQEAFRPPLFPFLISGLMHFGFGLFVQFLPILFAIFSVFVLGDLVRMMYDRKTGIWAALILASSHFFLFYSLKLLTESFFILLTLLMIYFYYLGLKKNRTFFSYSGIFLALGFLTRYLGGVLFIVYLFYPLLLGKKKEIKKIYKSKYYWLGFVISIIILIPWFLNGVGNYGSPIGALFAGFGEVASEWYIGPWFFHFEHWIEFFGLIGLFAIPGIYVLAKDRTRENKLILLLVVISILSLILIPRKEVRYMLHFFHIYAIMIGIGIVSLRKRWKGIFSIIAILLILVNLFVGVQMIQSDLNNGSSLKEAGLWVGERIGYGENVMSENYPVLYYTTGTRIIQFPETFSVEYLVDNRVSYIILDSREPSYPDYVWNEEGSPSHFFDEFTLEKVYERKIDNINYEKAQIDVWVYKV
ncbi:MAG: glycosyltransferase family 39 protein [Candidatus Aenigmatarchaeota archaeon]